MLTRFHSYTIVFLLAVNSVRAFDNPVLAAAINATAQQAARQEYVAAATALAPLLTNTVYETEFAQAWCTQREPCAVYYHNQCFWWLQCAGQNVGTDEINRVLATYAAPARGQRWPAYKWLHDRLLVACARDPWAKRAACERVVRYDPTDPLRMATLLHVLADAPTNEVAQWLAVYQGPAFPELLLLQARRAQRAGGSAFPFAIECLAAFPTARFDQVREAVELARAALDAANAQQVRSYYTTIVTASLKQANDAACLPTLAYLINEKKRLEAVLPELRAVNADQGAGQ
ncbi:MAG: hypothetical protein NTV22_18585 [bacterium]|nr:hypothetical protein [bacterium]